MEIDTVHRYPSYFLKDKVDKQLHCLQSQGIIPSIQFSDRTAQIVPVIKSNSNNHICGDYEITKKIGSKARHIPIAKSWGLILSPLRTNGFDKVGPDMCLSTNWTRWSVEKYITINKFKGVFQFNILLFSISSASSIFQKLWKTLLSGVQGTSIYQDDIFDNYLVSCFVF